MPATGQPTNPPPRGSQRFSSYYGSFLQGIKVKRRKFLSAWLVSPASLTHSHSFRHRTLPPRPLTQRNCSSFPKLMQGLFSQPVKWVLSPWLGEYSRWPPRLEGVPTPDITSLGNPTLAPYPRSRNDEAPDILGEHTLPIFVPTMPCSFQNAGG